MDLVGKRYWFFLISAIVILPGVVSLFIPPALKPGIEFTSGSALTLNFSREVSESEVRAVLTDLGHPEAVIQSLGGNSVFIRTSLLKEGGQDAQGNPIEGEKTLIERALQDKLDPNAEIALYEKVSPAVARETVRSAGIAVGVATVIILLYITWAFRRVPNPFRYGVCAIVALIHDLLVVVGTFSILGKVLNMEVNAMFIVGLLAVLGYSVNDTIVVFDRVRENISRAIERPLTDTINLSIWESMGRSLNTSLTTMLVLLALLLFGGVTVRPFILVLVIGIATGTYSSIFIASQVLVSWERGDFGRLLRRLRLAPARSS